MKVYEAIKQLQGLPGNLEIMDPYGELTISSFTQSSYGDKNGHDYVCYDEIDVDQE